ncbi:hypothetical protein [Foetidibacter luteolus]|uniref:hypothetical protein n=1 Tax=Foetidibacter luteolus TaxID=2608880 RepID=UPI00129C081B|nr:hypothetical protein [Foetidibacter luteolus]
MSIHAKMDKLILTLDLYEFKRTDLKKIKAVGRHGIKDLITTVEKDIADSWRLKKLILINLEIIDNRFETLEGYASVVDILIEMKFVLLTFGDLLESKKSALEFGIY